MGEVMEKIIYSATDSGGDGTSLKGYILASYRELVDMFGDPAYGESGDSKCTFTFVVNYEISYDGDCEYGTFTLYDWKGNRPYDDNERFEVHVGGSCITDSLAAENAIRIFNKTDARYTTDKDCMSGVSFDMGVEYV